MDEYHLLKKYRDKNQDTSSNNNSFKKIILTFISQILICIIICLVCLILSNNTKFRDNLYNFVYSSNFSFLEIQEFIEKKFGKIIPDVGGLSTTEVVSSEKLNYNNLIEIEDGVLLEVDQGSTIFSLESGLVVFIGEKEEFGNVLILEQVDGVEAWYVGITSSDLKIYDYVEKGSIVGQSNSDEIKLYFKNEGEGVDYKTYLF